jgi:hypothetical protein
MRRATAPADVILEMPTIANLLGISFSQRRAGEN